MNAIKKSIDSFFVHQNNKTVLHTLRLLKDVNRRLHFILFLIEKKEDENSNKLVDIQIAVL